MKHLKQILMFSATITFAVLLVGGCAWVRWSIYHAKYPNAAVWQWIID